MKLLKRLLLLVACISLLPALQGAWQYSAVSKPADTVITTHTAVVQLPHIQEENSRKLFNYRSRGLQDFHELLLYVASIRIKSLFVYIQPCYKGYAQSYISVAVTLSDWRGPPMA